MLPPLLPRRLRELGTNSPFQFESNRRHEWYQNDTSVFVDVFFKNIPKDKCSVEMEPQAVRKPVPS